MKRKIELPKELRKWLGLLKKGLKKLNTKDRDDILFSYVEQFSEELSQGKTAPYILVNLRPIAIIIEEIYKEFNIDTYSKKENKIKNSKFIKVEITDNNSTSENINWTFSKVLANTFTFSLSLIIWTVTIVFGIATVLFPIADIFQVIITYINYDVYFGTSIALIFIAAGPFLTALLLFSTILLYRISIKLANPFKIRKNLKSFAMKIWLIWLIILGAFMAATVGLTMAFAYKDGYFDYIAHNKYKNSEELISFSSYQEFVDKINSDNDLSGKNEITEDMLKKYFEEINQDSWFDQSSNVYRYTEYIDMNDNNPETFSFSIIRNYNLREDYVIDGEISFEVLLLDNEITNILIKIPNLDWYNLIMNWQPEQLQFIYNFN